MGPAIRVNHERGELERFLGSLEPGSPVALEAGLNWMWMVEQIEKANLEPHLTNPLEAKKRMGGVNKLDSSDAAGLLTLLRSGTLPEVWIPRGGQRDLRGLVRSRLVLRRHVSGLKCRIHGVLTQYGLKALADEEDETEYRDWFTLKARVALLNAMEELPPATREAMRQEYLAMWELERHVKSLETAIQARAGSLGWMRLLRTMPGVGLILGATIWTEIGEVRRFANAERLAAYAGLTPRTHSSGGKTWRGPTPRAASDLFVRPVETDSENAAQFVHNSRRYQKYIAMIQGRAPNVERTARTLGKGRNIDVAVENDPKLSGFGDTHE